jgi:fibronectin type 3 domain-containing protein
MKAWIKSVLLGCVCAVMLGCGGSDDPPPPPPAPASLSVEPGDEVNTVQWPAVASATSYNLYWSETTPVAKATAQVIKDAVSPYRHTGRTNGRLVYYAVTSVNADGESDLSAEIGAMPVAPVPAPPGTVNATPGDRMVTIAWVPVSRADSYTLYWSNTAGFGPTDAGVTKVEDIQATSYAHLSLTNGTAYYYLVTAVSTGGESVVSAQASATPLPPAPGAPANLTATSGDAHAHLSWSASLDATSYNVYESRTAGIVVGAAGVTQIPGLTATSHEPTGLTNGETYYYAVSSVGPGGESALSNEVSVRPLPPAPPAPLGLTAIAPKDVTQVTVQWFDVTDYPSAAAPIQLGYNIYRGLQPGLATYYKDASRATKIANVTAPFVDATVAKATTYYYVVTSFVPAIPDVESVASGEVSATTGRGGGSGGGGEGDTGYGNNLSFPVVFADGYGITGLKLAGTWPGLGPFTTVPTFDYNTGLRPLSTETLSTFPLLSSDTAVSLGGVTYYPQATASTWQAEWRNNAAAAQMETIVDWGDALLSKTYTASSIVRIETTLKQDATIAGVTDTMTAYKMVLLSGSQTTELQGTDGTTIASPTRNVFAINARLKIEKIATGGGADTVIFDKAVYEGFGVSEEGGGGSAVASSKYGAELNVAGSIVYGYNFRLNSVTGIPDKKGQYRITFSLDPQATVGTESVANHVKMVTKSDAGATLATDGLSSSVVITVN